MSMEDAEIEAAARSGGLEILWEHFSHEVRAAAEAARSQRRLLSAISDPAIETWPPMRVAHPL